MVKLFTHTKKEKDSEEHAEATGVEGRGNKQHQKRRWVRLETVQKLSSWTKLHCVCGRTKSTEEEVFLHKTKRHIETNSWICGYKDCKVKCTSSGSLKNLFLRYISKNFCTIVSTVIMVTILMILCIHIWLPNMVQRRSLNVGNFIPKCGVKFASVLHLKKHQLTCGIKEKQHICQICDKGYMKKKPWCIT